MLSAWNHRNDYCLDMYEELEVEIWKASEYINKQDIIPIETIPNPEEFKM